jgi:hypothetical protein
MSNKAAPQEQILPIVLGYWQARAFAATTELGVPDLLTQGPLHVEALASLAYFRSAICATRAFTARM